MKQNLAPILAATVLAAAMSIVPSCRKAPVNDPYSDPLNPPVKDLPAAAFTLSADEDRYTTLSFPWIISADGKTDSVREEIDDMCVTSYNVLTLFVEGSGAAYKGVNVASSNTAAVQVAALGTREGKEAFSLTYVKDGEADITVWNGSGAAGEKRTTFHVTAVKAIVPKAVVFVLDEGTEREKEVRTTEWFIDEEERFRQYYVGLINLHKTMMDERSVFNNGEWHVYVDGKEADGLSSPQVLHTLRYDRVEPENTSFRTIDFTSKRYNEFVNPKWLEYLKSQNLSTDWVNEWKGDIEDLKKECFLFCGWDFNGVHISLCELSLRCVNPKGSSICQTALLCCVQHQFTWRITY